MMTNTAYELLDRRASSHPDRVAFGFLTQPTIPTLTYAELRRHALGIASLLADRCAPGDRALLLLDSGIDLVASLFGCFYAGVVAVAATATATREALRRNVSIAIDCEPRCIVTDRAHAAQADAIVAAASLAGIERIDPASAQPTGIDPAAPLHELAALQYTSGSTGSPKGVRLRHEQLLDNARAVGLAFDLDEESVGVGWLPLSHDMGLVGNVLVPVLRNFPVHLMPPAAMLRRPAAWLRAISDCRATVSGGPGFAYDLCVDRVEQTELEGIDLSTWRVAYVGGSALSPATLHRFASRFERERFAARSFVPCYGLAESALFVAGRRAEAPPTVTTWNRADLSRGLARESRDADDLASVGHRLAPRDARIDLRIVHPHEDRALPDGEVGEICVSSRSITDSYFSGPIATTGDGMLRTGDCGFLAGGELHVLGRIREAIRTAAGLVYPHDVEDAVRRLHPMLAESAAFAVPATEGDQLVIVQGVRARAGHDVDPRRLTALAQRLVAERFSIALGALVLVPARHVRRTTSGKVQRLLMRQEYLAAEHRETAGGAGRAHVTTADTLERV